MSKPIPDAALRHIAGFTQHGVDTSTPFSPQNVARALLELRVAARRYLSANEPDDRGESEFALRALLPKEPS